MVGGKNEIIVVYRSWGFIGMGNEGIFWGDGDILCNSRIAWATQV